MLETITKFVASDGTYQRFFREARLLPVLARLLSGFAEAADGGPADAQTATVFNPTVLANMFQPESVRGGTASDATDDPLPTPLDVYMHLCQCIQAMLDGNALNRAQFLSTYVRGPLEPAPGGPAAAITLTGLVPFFLL